MFAIILYVTEKYIICVPHCSFIEKEIALKFFSNLAGTKHNVGGTDIKYHRNYAEGTCNACGRGKIEDALDALAR